MMAEETGALEIISIMLHAGDGDFLLTPVTTMDMTYSILM